MRNSRLMKIITVILALSVIVLAAFATSAFADGTGEPAEARVKVVSKNAAYESKTQLIFAVQCDDLKANEEIYFLFWNADPVVEGKTAEELFNSAAYRKTAYEKNVTVLEAQGCQLIASNGIAAKNINSDIYILPVIRTSDNSTGVATYTYEVGAELFTYSVKDYALEKLDDSNRFNNTDAQNRLYENIIKYGEAAAKMFSESAE